MKEIVYVSVVFFLLLISSSSFGLGRDEAGHKNKKKVRPAAVAGQFYPAEAGRLKKMLQHFFKEGKGNTVSGKIRGLICPHAGYIYSGPIAASGYRQIDPATRTVFVLAPSHYVAAAKASILNVDFYRTPLGDIPLSPLAATLRKQELFSPIPAMHGQEHSLEVQLPFLQEMVKNFELVPIVIGQADPKPIAEALLPYIDENTLIVVSSDLSHYYSYERAKILDQNCIKAITSFDFAEMPESEACGKIPILVLMEIARQKGWRGELIDARNSGDTAGPPDQVVGYASIAFVSEEHSRESIKSHHEVISEISEADQKTLLAIARGEIKSALRGGKKFSLPNNLSPYLKQKRGCFVTLHKKGQLRGCIGTISPVQQLCDCVKENAFNAAFRDPRFSPLTSDELDQLEIEISVLTLPKQIHFSDPMDLKQQLRPGRDGVILSQGYYRATYLPQVWEQLPDKDSFLASLSQKAGLSKDAWKDSEIKIEVYQAMVFSE